VHSAKCIHSSAQGPYNNGLNVLIYKVSTL